MLNIPKKIIVIQLEESDMFRLLCLAQKQVDHQCTDNLDWRRITNEMMTCILAQNGKKFFQCTACQNGGEHA